MNLKDAIDAYFRDVDDEQFLRAVQAAGFKPIPRRSWVDRLAFALMWPAAIWDFWRWQLAEPAYIHYLSDGWKAARYV